MPTKLKNSADTLLRKERKVLFLDIDGVCNSEQYAISPRHSKGQMLGIDAYPAFLVGKIQLDTGCDVVLSSTWRLWEDQREEVRKRVVDFIDVTPDFRRGVRGEEIASWLEQHPDVTRYAILDDDSDMLPDQMSNFFKTTFKLGLTDEIAKRVTEHLNA